MIDLGAVRADTPGCHDLIFLDNAGSSLPPAPVLAAVQSHLAREAVVGGYRAAAERRSSLEEGYSVLASLLGCSPTEVAFTDSASRSWLLAVDALGLQPGDRALVPEVEYHSNALALMNLGVSISVVPSDASGAMDLAALESMLDPSVKLVSLVHVPTNGGLINPVSSVAALAHSVGASVILDACQSLGQLPLSFESLGVDAITGTGRKWIRGPRGTGVLAIRSSLRPRLVDGRGALWDSPSTFTLEKDAKAFELWEYSVADRLGLIEAARYALNLGVSSIASEISSRASLTRSLLSAIPGVAVHDLGRSLAGIVSFSVDGMPAETVRDRLWDLGVAVSVTYDTSTQFDMTRRGLHSLVRASPHYFVSPDQIHEFVAKIREI
ncbi:aminotransferase class V-fold PLP-dependent enzyme [Actinocrispum sp. NPDC049592]|uniref:aminotransferase class V-fold PLP-dependent enzyme n=1 Tax=Actinocrispum sp. NPDC049592 TaxID=3154835 RepID=UPI00342347B8